MNDVRIMIYLASSNKSRIHFEEEEEEGGGSQPKTNKKIAEPIMRL